MEQPTVVYNADTGKWDAYIGRRYIGAFNTKDDAWSRLESMKEDYYSSNPDYAPTPDNDF